jgi:hypothetical protein
MFDFPSRMSHPNKGLRLAALVAASICIACDSSTAPAGPPSALHSVTPASFNAVAGSAIAGGVTVRVVDSRGNSITGSRVAFTVTAGDGTVSPHIILSAGDGTAHAEWTIGQTAGQNSLVASIEGVDSTTTFSAVGTPGPATAVAVTPHVLRFPAGTMAGTLFGAVVDQYGNTVIAGATYTSRNPSLVTVNSTTGAVTVVGSGGTTYVVAAGSNFSDSSLVIVLKSTDTPCTGITAHSNLAVGDVITTGFSDNGICVDATTTGGEYAWVPYFNSSVPSALTSFTLSVFGNRDSVSVFNATRPVVTPLMMDAAAATATAWAREAFHDRIRAAEEQAMPAAAQGARLWYGSAERTAHRALRTTVVPSVGDQMQLNVNANDFCTNPMIRTGRVAAVTQRAVVVADTANPDGFTDAEYASFGVTFDTLVYPLDVANFGTPTDIDDNGGRIVLFFTHAVNGLGGGVLGYYYGRDLLPKSGPLGSCPGSNVSEIMYLLVPDATFSKTFVVTNTIGTVAHEFQHMINAGRRLYVNTSAAPTEERWLNEGLSHIAEELMFYRVSGLKPRQNLGPEISTAQYSQIYRNYQYNNFARLKEYLRTPDSQSPIGIDDNDDDFPTRGAIWSYLRYAADQRFSADEAGFWFKLVNSNVTGLNNLYDAVGADARFVMRDWTLAILLDDLVPGVNAKYQQPSWNLRVAMATVGGYSLSTFPLTTSGSPTGFALRAGGTIFARFRANANQEVYVSAGGNGGTALPKNVLLALVRTK